MRDGGGRRNPLRKAPIRSPGYGGRGGVAGGWPAGARRRGAPLSLPPLALRPQSSPPPLFAPTLRLLAAVPPARVRFASAAPLFRGLSCYALPTTSVVVSLKKTATLSISAPDLRETDFFSDTHDRPMLSDYASRTGCVWL